MKLVRNTDARSIDVSRVCLKCIYIKLIFNETQTYLWSSEVCCYHSCGGQGREGVDRGNVT
jgi:hypothetical protein